MVLNLPWRFLLLLPLPTTSPPLFRLCTTLSSPSHPSPRKYLKNYSPHSPNKHPNASVVTLLRRCRNVEELKALNTHLVLRGLIPNNAVIFEYVKACFYLGCPDMALSAFRMIEKRSLFLQNVIIRGLCDRGLYEEIMCVYLKCRGLGCPSDNFTFPFVIKACAALGAFGIGKEVHCVVLRTGFEENVVVQTALIDFYAKNGRMGDARKVIDKIPKPDLVCWNALIAGYSLNGLDEDAFEVFEHVRAMGLKPNVSTLASIIPVCTRMGILDVGKSLHSFAVKSGYFSNAFLIPAMIAMYASDLDISVARNLFDLVTSKNVTVWNAMISAYTQRQKSFEASELFCQLLQAELQPDFVTFVSVIPSCEHSGSILYGQSLHAFVIKHGLDNHLPVLTALVSMYSKLGDINAAKFLFDQLPNRNLLLWNSMISGYVYNGFWDATLNAVSEMQFAGIDADEITTVSILSACSKLGARLPGRSAHAYSIKRNIDSNLNVSNALLALYSDCGQVLTTFKLFHKMARKNVVSWNTLISGCVHNGEMEKAVSLLHQMQNEGLRFDLVTIISILPCYNEIKGLGQGMAVHGYAIKTGFVSDVSLVNALISMYFTCGDPVAGKLLFGLLPERSVVSWNALLTSCRYQNLENEVLALFSQMMKEHQRPNHVTLLNLLPACCSQLQGKSIHAFAARRGFVQEIRLLTSLIFMYARFENMKLCLLLYEMGEKKDISLWNAIISVHVQTQYAERAVAFFCELLQMGLEPDHITVLSLVSACGQLTSLYLSYSVMAFVIRKGFETDIVINNALIDLYARWGNISIAKMIFEGLREKDAISWGMMINAYGIHGDGEAALNLFSQMELSGMKPDSMTYSSILSACSHAGLAERGRKVFNSMVQHGVSPKMEHYACMVDLLGRTGHLNEAYDIAKSLPCKPSVSLLESLLGACIVHGNVDLGEKISSMLFHLDSKNPRPYVMLHNIYAAAGRWADANRVRADMEGRKLRKLRGFSIVEGNEVCDERLS